MACHLRIDARLCFRNAYWVFFYVKTANPWGRSNLGVRLGLMLYAPWTRNVRICNGDSVDKQQAQAMVLGLEVGTWPAVPSMGTTTRRFTMYSEMTLPGVCYRVNVVFLEKKLINTSTRRSYGCSCWVSVISRARS